MVRATRLSSPQQLYALLGSRPAALYLADDYGDQVRIARRQPSGLLEQTLSLITGTVASGADLLLDNWQELGLRHQDGDGSSYPTICSPVLSVLGTIAGVQCGKVFGAQEVSRGSIDSFLFVPATDVDHWRARARAFASVEAPDEVVERLRTLRGFAPEATTQTPQQMFEENGWLQPTPITVRFTGDVQRVEKAWLSQYQRQSPTIRALASAARSRLRRICTAMAAFANPQAPVADQAIVSWAAGWVGYCLEQTIVEADLRLPDRAFGAVVRSAGNDAGALHQTRVRDLELHRHMPARGNAGNRQAGEIGTQSRQGRRRVSRLQRCEDDDQGKQAAAGEGSSRSFHQNALTLGDREIELLSLEERTGVPIDASQNRDGVLANVLVSAPEVDRLVRHQGQVRRRQTTRLNTRLLVDAHGGDPVPPTRFSGHGHSSCTTVMESCRYR